MYSFAQPRAAKIEAQDWKSKPIESFGCVVHNFVMHGAAMKRMWMADQCRIRRFISAGVEQSFESAARSLKKQRLNFVWHAIKVGFAFDFTRGIPIFSLAWILCG